MKTRKLFAGLLAGALIATALSGRAQTWTGGGPDSNIDDPANWDTLPAFDGSETPTFASGGTVATINTNVSFYGLNFSAPAAFTIASGGGTLTNGAGGITTAGAASTIASPVEITANQIWPISASLTISGAIDDGGSGFSILKSLTGTLTLNGANTYGGPTTFNGGTVYFNSIGMVGGGASALGAPTNAANGTINLGGSVNAYYSGGTATSDRIINLTGTATLRTDTATGPLTLTGGITGSGTLGFRTAQTITETGVINIGGNSLTRTSSGTLILNNAANVFGYVDIYQGTISVDSIADSGVSSSFGNGTHFAMGQATTLGTLQFTGPNGGECNRAIAITGTSSSGGGIIQNTVAGQTLTMSGTVDTASGSVAPAFQLTGVGNGVMSGTIQNSVGSLFLTKAGTGIWTLSGTNTYTGTTTVSAGTLLINGVIGTNTVSVAAGATLGGSGMIGGAVNVAAAGNLAPGGLATLGILALTNTGASALTLNGNNLTFLLNTPVTPGTNYDQLAITGGLVLNGANHINLGLYNGEIESGTYTLITYAAKTGSGTLTFTNGSTTMGNYSLTVGPTSVTLNVSADVVNTSMTWKGDVSGTWDTVTPNWVIGVTPTTYTDGTNVVFDDTAVNFSITNGTVSPGSVTFENNVNGYSVAANIQGPGSISINGSGSVSLSGNSSYSGGTTLNAGTLAVSNNYALGTGTLTIAGNTTLSALANLTLSNNILLNAIPAFNLGANTLTLAGDITGEAIGAVLTLSSGGLALSGTNFIAASSSSAQQFKVAGGDLTLTGGSTTFSNVALYPTAGQILVSDGTHYFVGSVQNDTGFNMAGTLTITGGAVHTSWFSLGYGGAGSSSTFNMNGGYFDTTTSPLGSGMLIFAYNTPAADVDTLNLNGGTIHCAGIQVSGSSAPAANNIINLNGGILQASDSSENFINGSTNGITVKVQNNGAIFDTAGFSITVTNALLDGGGTNDSLTKLGAGTLELAGVNTYAGNTLVGAGELILDNPTLATNSTITVSNGAALNLNFAGGATNIIASLVLNGVNEAPGVHNNSTDPTYLTGAGSLLVQSTVVTANYPTNMSFSLTGNTFNLSWPATHLGWYAQSNSVDLANTNDWFDVPGSQNVTNLVITINPAVTNVFYRLRYP